MRRQRLVEHLHRLGPSPLGHFIREIEVATGIRLATNIEIAECRNAGTTFPAANLPDQFIHSLISQTGITVCVVMPLRSGEASEEQSKLLWNAAFEVACAAGKIAAERSS